MKIKVYFKETMWSYDSNESYNWNEHNETKNEIWKLFEWISNHIEARWEDINRTYKETNESITSLVKNKEAENIVQEFLKLTNTEYVLHSPEYRNNPEAKNLLEVINVLNLPGYASKKEIIDTISKVFDNPNIPKWTKLKIAKYLRENYFGFLVDKVWPDTIPVELDWKTYYIENPNNYISNPLKGVEIANELKTKYIDHPEYEFSNFIVVSDPEWWEVWTNNF